MKIATYNINGVNGRLPNLLRWLAEAMPDAVCLQELKATNDKFPEQALLGLGYHAIWQGQQSWNGVAILSRYGEIQETRRGLDDEPDDTHSRYIEAFINGVVIGCIYLPNGNPWPGPKFEYKLRWMERLQKHADKLRGFNLPIALAGDFNVIPTEFDTYKPEKYIDNALFRPQSRDLFKKLVDSGWTDAIRELHPDKRLYTFWDYLRNAYARNAGLRLDHFLLNDILKDRLKSAEVTKAVRGWDHSSDHAPVWIEIRD